MEVKKSIKHERILTEKRKMKPVQRNCHDCGAAPGELHKENCDSPRCTICGTQLLQCKHKEGNSVHSGIESQEIEILCEALELFSRWEGSPPSSNGIEAEGWVKCSREEEGAIYDLNLGVQIYAESLTAVRKRELLKDG